MQAKSVPAGSPFLPFPLSLFGNGNGLGLGIEHPASSIVLLVPPFSSAPPPLRQPVEWNAKRARTQNPKLKTQNLTPGSR